MTSLHTNLSSVKLVNVQSVSEAFKESSVWIINSLVHSSNNFRSKDLNLLVSLSQLGVVDVLDNENVLTVFWVVEIHSNLSRDEGEKAFDNQHPHDEDQIEWVISSGNASKQSQRIIEANTHCVHLSSDLEPLRATFQSCPESKAWGKVWNTKENEEENPTEVFEIVISLSEDMMCKVDQVCNIKSKHH